MSNNLPVHLSKAIEAMESAAVAIDASSGDFSYLKLTKAGEWVYGAEDDEIAKNSIFAVDTESFFAGFQAWGDGTLEGEQIRVLTDVPLIKSELPDVGADWKALLGFQLTCVEGDDLGLQLVYKTTSVGGIKSVNNLMKAIVAHVKSGKHNGKLIPEIALETDNYRHKKYGKIYTPLLDVVGWTDEMPVRVKAEAKADAEPEVEEIEEEIEEVQEPAPRRRRRVA